MEKEFQSGLSSMWGESQSKEARDFQRGTHVTFMRFISFDHQSGLLAPNLTVFFLLELLIRVPLFKC